MIFGDGAGAVVLGRGADPRRGILTTHLHSEGKYAEEAHGRGADVALCDRACRPGDAERARRAACGRAWKGRYVFKHAVTRFPR